MNEQVVAIKFTEDINIHLINIQKDSKDASDRQDEVPFKERPEHVNLYTNYA